MRDGMTKIIINSQVSVEGQM
ncbi:Hypothetical protein A131_54741 [Lactobacillus gasseri CECT 5714]|nr:Hypothetical protein A131_54741 [Lactobacillus gasseri CECT 5714]